MIRRFPIGLRYMVLAAFFFSLMSLLVKIAGQRLPTAELVLGRSVISLVLSYIMIRRNRISPWGKNRSLLCLRGLFGFVGLMCFFYAIPRLPLADVTVLQYTYPVIVTVLAALLLKETFNRILLISLVLSLVGVVLIAHPSFIFGQNSETLDLLAVGIASLGAFFTAFAYTSIRKLRETEHPIVVVFYFPLVTTPLCVPLLYKTAIWPAPREWLLLLGIGVLTQIAQLFLTHGLHKEKAGRATTVSYLQIFFAACWGMIFLGEYPDLLTIFGTLFVVGGILLVARDSKSEP